MKENRIESFAELETALNNLLNLSSEITATLNETNAIFETQNEAWRSVNSTSQANKMQDYASESLKIAKNVQEVSETIQKFKTQTHDIDAQG